MTGQEPAVYHPQHHHFYHRGAHLWKRFGRIAVAGTGFLADAYDLFVINVALLMMKQNKNYHVKLTPDIQGQVSMMAIVGAMTGQMIFGVLGDQIGRRMTFFITALLVISFTVAQACAQPVDGYWNIYRQLMLFRFLMGIGIGGEYPLSSSITSETSDERHRGRNLAAVFSMQGFGRVLCAAMLLLSAYVIEDTNWQWRFAILMGAVPMILALYFRWRMHETELYVRDVQSRNFDVKERTMTILKIVWANRVRLAGTAGSWFILDVLFYGNSLFSADITRAMGIENTIQGKALQNLYIQLIALPGYIMGIFFMDKVGRKRLQLFGFAGEAIIFAFMAAFLAQIKNFRGLFICLYALTFFFDDFGPNLTTFVIPAEIYPTEVRSTCHGISAAFGKAGAALSARLFLKLKDIYCPGDFCDKHAPQYLVDKGLRLTFMVCSVLAVIGFIWTFVLVTDKPDKSLADAESVYDVEPEKDHAEEMKIEMVKQLEAGNKPVASTVQ